MLKPCYEMEFTSAGSLLIGRSSEEVDALKRRVTLLYDAGLRAEYLSGSDLLLEEPDLLVDKDTGAAFLPDDCQLDAQRAVAYIQKVCVCVCVYIYILVTLGILLLLLLVSII